MNYNLTHLTDRELLMVIAEKQDSHMTQHTLLAQKVSKIEEKIIEDIESRIRNLENERNQRKGAMQFWLLLLGGLTAFNTILTIYKTMH